MLPQRFRENRILCLQPSSIFERYGGAEYFFDDLLTQAAQVLRPGHVRTIVPRREENFSLVPRLYSIEAVRFRRKGLLQKIENRYSNDFFWTALANTTEFKPSFLLCAHVSLAPLTFALSRLTKLPYYTIALGIETWGNLWPQDEFALKHSHGILSISQWTKEILIKRGYDPEKIFVIHPTVNKTFGTLPPPRRTVREDQPLKLFTPARLDAGEKYKGQDHVIEALKLFREANPTVPVQYTIQGDGADKERLQNLANALKVNDIVHFRSATKDRDALLAGYQDSDLLIMPSRFGRWDGKWHGEGFGIVYIEAAMLGVPSIAYNCGGVKDIIRNNENGLLVPPEDKKGLATAIERFALDKPLSIQMGARAYDIAKNLFSPEQMQKAFIHFLTHA